MNKILIILGSILAYGFAIAVIIALINLFKHEPLAILIVGTITLLCMNRDRLEELGLASTSGRGDKRF